MGPRARAKPSRALEGEDLKTSHWEDARHWMSIHADLLEFKRGILDRVKRDLAGLQPLARKAAAVDLQIIDDQMQGYQARLDLWYRRTWDLHATSLFARSRKKERTNEWTKELHKPEAASRGESRAPGTTRSGARLGRRTRRLPLLRDDKHMHAGIAIEPVWVRNRLRVDGYVEYRSVRVVCPNLTR
jgi:hypothetical protein